MIRGSATLTVAGDVTNSGSLRAVRTVAGAGSVDFSLTKAQINVTTPGTLSSVQVDRIDAHAPQSTLPALETGRYWDITPAGSGFAVNLTLPYNSAQVSDPLLARYDGSRWTASRSSMTAAEATLEGVTEFSLWTISTGTVPVTLSGYKLE